MFLGVRLGILFVGKFSKYQSYLFIKINPKPIYRPQKPLHTKFHENRGSHFRDSVYNIQGLLV